MGSGKAGLCAVDQRLTRAELDAPLSSCHIAELAPHRRAKESHHSVPWDTGRLRRGPCTAQRATTNILQQSCRLATVGASGQDRRVTRHAGPCKPANVRERRCERGGQRAHAARASACRPRSGASQPPYWVLYQHSHTSGCIANNACRRFLGSLESKVAATAHSRTVTVRPRRSEKGERQLRLQEWSAQR